MLVYERWRNAFHTLKAIIIAHESPEFSSILENIAGVLFFGCIHDERPPNFQECCLRCASVELRIPSTHQVAESLKSCEKWIFVRRLLEQFRELPTKFQIKSFFETKETVYRARKFAFGQADLVRGPPYDSLYHLCTLLIWALALLQRHGKTGF